MLRYSDKVRLLRNELAYVTSCLALQEKLADIELQRHLGETLLGHTCRGA